MNLYPLDLVLATALAWATIFVGALPVRMLREEIFRRAIALCGGTWIVVALLTPASVIHYYVLLGLLCLYAWRELRNDRALRAKGWFMGAAGLGISLGVLLILAETPGAFPAGMFTGEQVVALATVYLGGAVTGLAAALYFFTRREATRAGMPVATVQAHVKMLVALSVARAALLLFSLICSDAMPPLGLITSGKTAPVSMNAGWLRGAILVSFLCVLPVLAWIARRRCISPQPSTAAGPLVCFFLVSLAGEILARLLVLPP